MKKLKLLTIFAIVSVIFFAGCKKDDYKATVGVCPLVVSTVPTDKAINVPLNQVVSATFNEKMNPETITQASFTLQQGTTAIAGTVSYTGLVAAFAPASPLAPFTTYSGRVKTSVKDLLGNALQTDYVWSFTTIPQVALTSNQVAGGTIGGAGTFAQGSLVTVTATPNPGYSFTNWTENGTIVSTTSSYQYAMNGNRILVANYALISNNTFTLNVIANNGSVLKNPDMVSYTSGATVQLTATPNSGYTFTSWSGDASGSVSPLTVTMNADKNITANFTADVITPGSPAGVNLGSAGNFAILAGSGISNTGVTTHIIGDVGSFPSATINGLLAGNVDGILYTAADPLVGTAKNDLTTAYNDAQSRSLNAISLPGQLGGLTLAPGLYVNSSTSGISGTGANGILTLDAGGDANAVWIFKTGSTLVTDAGTSIVLAGGAQAKNIYWSVGTSATLGTNSIFYGNILADQAITLTTGATLYGRALTRIAAVTLDSSTITKP